jgi:hypothetical protein
MRKYVNCWVLLPTRKETAHLWHELTSFGEMRKYVNCWVLLPTRKETAHLWHELTNLRRFCSKLSIHPSETCSLIMQQLPFQTDTTRNTGIGCALSKAVLRESHLKYYQQLFISFTPFQLLRAGLSAVVHVLNRCRYVSYRQRFRNGLLIIRCTINSSLLCEPFLIRLFCSGS